MKKIPTRRKANCGRWAIGVTAIFSILFLLWGCGGGGSEQTGASSTDGEASTNPQSTFIGEHENLKPGDKASWTEGYNLKLSDPTPTKFIDEPNRGKDALEVKLDMWNTGSQTVEFHATWPCRAQDKTGSLLRSSGLTEGEQSTEEAFMTPLEPGQERTRYIAFDPPKDGGEVEIICSLAYLSGEENPPPAEQASWIINLANLS